MAEPIPLIVLAGSSPRRGPVPAGMKADDMLGRHKGAERLPNGRLLVGEVIDRFISSGRFDSPALIGPERIFREMSTVCEVVDAEGPLATTLERTVQTIRRKFGAETPIAITTCDILPTSQEVTSLLESSYDPVRECVFWSQLVEAAVETMAASAWKPTYGFIDPSSHTRRVYPGHLVILRPAGLRFEVAIRLLHLTYAYRNTPLSHRLPGFVVRSLGTLILQDLRNLLRLQAPTLTTSVPYYGLRAYAAHARGRLSLAAFEEAFTKIFVHRAYHDRASGRPAVFAVTQILSFAKDIDTKAELQEAIRHLSCDSA